MLSWIDLRRLRQNGVMCLIWKWHHMLVQVGSPLYRHFNQARQAVARVAMSLWLVDGWKDGGMDYLITRHKASAAQVVAPLSLSSSNT
jgi:hypothetical protein